MNVKKMLSSFLWKNKTNQIKKKHKRSPNCFGCVQPNFFSEQFVCKTKQKKHK